MRRNLSQVPAGRKKSKSGRDNQRIKSSAPEGRPNKAGGENPRIVISQSSLGPGGATAIERFIQFGRPSGALRIVAFGTWGCRPRLYSIAAPRRKSSRRCGGINAAILARTFQESVRSRISRGHATQIDEAVRAKSPSTQSSFARPTEQYLPPTELWCDDANLIDPCLWSERPRLLMQLPLQ